MPAKDTVATVITCLRYRDAPAAIDWLQHAFGFEPQLVVPDAHGGIAHAQLRFGNGMVIAVRTARSARLCAVKGLHVTLHLCYPDSSVQSVGTRRNGVPAWGYNSFGR